MKEIGMKSFLNYDEAERKNNFLDPNCTTTIDRRLRRTLLRSVILIIKVGNTPRILRCLFMIKTQWKNINNPTPISIYLLTLSPRDTVQQFFDIVLSKKAENQLL